MGMLRTYGVGDHRGKEWSLVIVAVEFGYETSDQNHFDKEYYCM